MQAKGAKILGAFWPNDLEVVVVTDKGVEHYQVVMVMSIEQGYFKMNILLLLSTIHCFPSLSLKKNFFSV